MQHVGPEGSVKEAKLHAALVKMGPRVISHMNDDHPESLKAYAVHYAGLADASSAKMVGMDARGFTLKVTRAAPADVEEVLVTYPRPLESAGDVCKLAVEMHFAAFKALGLKYRLTNGYYTGAAKHAAEGVVKLLGGGARGASLALLAGGALAAADALAVRASRRRIT